MLSGCEKEEAVGCEYAVYGKEFVEDGGEEEEKKSGQRGVGVRRKRGVVSGKG